MKSAPSHLSAPGVSPGRAGVLLALIILSALTAIALPRLAGRSEQARAAAARTQLALLGRALDAYKVDTGTYPQGGDGLDALVGNVDGTRGWMGPYIAGKKVILDPWGHGYVYACPGKHNARSFDLYSPGPDGRVSTDDIANWQK